MTESGLENMEGKATVVPSAVNGREPAPKSKGQWKGRNRTGRNNNFGRYPGQEHYRQQRDPSDRKDGRYSQPQRSGTVPDRRPPPRGPFNRNLDSRKGTKVAAGQDNPVIGPRAGSKKYGTSLNHLLNFKYAPRERPVVYHSRSGSKKYTPFNKEQFIQANNSEMAYSVVEGVKSLAKSTKPQTFRGVKVDCSKPLAGFLSEFVVRDSGDYAVHAMDPDVLVEWDSIEQVRIFSHEVPSCPICLYPSVAAKITRCGHIYCWSCILHYLSLTDKSWHKCPICYEAVHKKDLKSVVALESHPFSVGDTITMRLMKRAKNSLLVMPKAQWNDREFKPFGINDKEKTCYAKLLLASQEDVLKQIVAPEETELNTQLMEARSEKSEEVCFIEVAIAEIKARRESLTEHKHVEEVRNLIEGVTLDEDNQKNGKEITSWKILSPDDIQGVSEYEAAFSDEEEVFESEGVSSEDVTSECHLPKLASKDMCQAENSNRSMDQAGESASGDSGCESARPLSPVSTSTSYHYFYQADDGQNIFLSSVNSRCLIKEYGGLEYCPDTITAQILEMEALSQSDELRKRYRHLSHLPLTCEFVICELDVKPPIISQETLNFFKGEIQHRKQQRQKKLRIERKREQKTLSSGSSAFSYIPARSACRSVVPEHLDLSSDFEFPAQTGQLAISPPSNSTPSPFMQFAASMANQDEGYATIVETEGVNVPDNPTPSPPSFAQALRSKKATETIKKPQELVVTRKPSWAEEENDEEDCAPVPTFQSAFSDALVSANWGKYDVEATQPGAEREESTGKKQKKNKKKLLFTTGSFMKYT